MEDLNDNVVDDVLSQLEVKEAEHPTGLEMTEWVFTNDKTNPAIRNLFHIFYQSVFMNKLGLMTALHEPTNTVHTLIVGVDTTNEKVITWPLARVLTEDEQSAYKAPNGNGGYE